MYEKLTKCQNFTWFLPEKLSKYPNFYDICPKINKIPEFSDFCPKMPEFYIIIARKTFFPNLGAHDPCPLSYAYGCYCSVCHEWSSILWLTFGCVENCHVRTVSGTFTFTGTAYSRPALIQMLSDPSTSCTLSRLETRTTGAHVTLHGTQYIELRWWPNTLVSVSKETYSLFGQ